MRVCVCVLDNVKVINVANDREVIVDHLNSFPNSQFSRTAEAERERKEEGWSIRSRNNISDNTTKYIQYKKEEIGLTSECITNYIIIIIIPTYQYDIITRK